MDDTEQQCLAELRLKLRRITGHKDWSAKQTASDYQIVREIARIEGITDLRSVFERP